MAKLSRNTIQKQIIRKEIENQPSFFTGEDLFKKIKIKNPEIGIATIYRFLKELRNKREIHHYLCNRKTLYSLSKKNHCHFICEKCGKTEHIDIDKIDFLKNNISGEICHFQIDITGICDKCKK
ncbi:MAG: transcriptional repressor [Nanoarchaeota archaeon]